ncbi:hypothetical protein EDD22DRAFT_870645 [Suillus occidentalis]|nr:hypothetical protein EDD22DRAFT_870645 [Suillus occidentalis]
MLTARFTIFALFTFLASANAGCATCDTTLEVNGQVTYELVDSYMKYDNGYTVCEYVGTTALGGKVTCEYGNMGWLEDGDNVCPRFSEMDGGGCF